MKELLIVAAVALALAGCASPAKQSSAQSSVSEKYRVLLDTSQGPVVVDVDRALAPNGAKRFYELVKARYFDGARFYRVVPGFVVQWGAAADPAVTKKWRHHHPRRRPSRRRIRAGPWRLLQRDSRTAARRTFSLA